MTTPDVLRFLSVALYSETESTQRQNPDGRVRRLPERRPSTHGAAAGHSDGERCCSEPPPEAA
jgi:hypothetical protein